MAVTVVKSMLYRDAAALAVPTSQSGDTTYTLISIDLTSVKGYNFGAAGKYATATLDLKVSGCYSSGRTRLIGRYAIQIARNNGGAPTQTATALTGNVDPDTKLSFDISGNTFRARVTAFGTTPQEAYLSELDGPIVDMQDP